MNESLLMGGGPGVAAARRLWSDLAQMGATRRFAMRDTSLMHR